MLRHLLSHQPVKPSPTQQTDFTALPKDGIDSDDTEIYELTEQTIGTVMILDKKAANSHKEDHRTPFKCPEKSCKI